MWCISLIWRLKIIPVEDYFLLLSFCSFCHSAQRRSLRLLNIFCSVVRVCRRTYDKCTLFNIKNNISASLSFLAVVENIMFKLLRTVKTRSSGCGNFKIEIAKLSMCRYIILPNLLLVSIRKQIL